MTTEEIYEHYDGIIKTLFDKIKKVELKKGETLQRHEKLIKLYANSNKEKLINKIKIPKLQQQQR